MKRLFLAILFFSVASTAEVLANCVAQAERKWNNLTVEAFSQGPGCSNAVVTLAIRVRGGKAIWARAHIAHQLLNFSESPTNSPKAMTDKLRSWISGEGFMKSVDGLNLAGEFSFGLADGVSLEVFKAYQKLKLPLFCYIQGMESGNCLAVDKDGAVVELGVQSFPG
jgi:hypothetical protein